MDGAAKIVAGATQMRVLLVTGSYPPMLCGVGDYAGRLALALSRDPDLKVSVFTTALDAHAEPAAGMEVLRVARSWHARRLAGFGATLRARKPDIVHIQFPTQGYDHWSGLAAIAALCRFRWRTPVVLTLHEPLPRTTYRSDRWVQALALIANRIVVVRPEYHASMPWVLRLFIPARKIRFISNASALPVVELGESERQAMRRGVGCDGEALIAFFGFSYEHKGVDLLFRIADPARHRLLLIGHLAADDPYHARLRALADSSEWKGRVTITGFVEPLVAARMLSAADAAVFPYRVGGGVWNSSLHAATSQGTFVLTTSLERSGYDSAANVYYARPDDVVEMTRALLAHQGIRKPRPSRDPWLDIAAAHKELYLSLVMQRASR